LLIRFLSQTSYVLAVALEVGLGEQYLVAVVGGAGEVKAGVHGRRVGHHNGERTNRDGEGDVEGGRVVALGTAHVETILHSGQLHRMLEDAVVDDRLPVTGYANLNNP